MRAGRLLTVATFLAVGLLAVHCSKSSGNDDDGSPCDAPDQDGVIGGNFDFVVSVSDTALSPVILKAQNNSQISLTVKNVGTKPHDFVVDCLVAQGCTSCFPDAGNIPPLAPDASTQVTFTAPQVEGIYNVRSDVPGDSFTGQFILQ